jgi:hypothetical protein
MSAPLSPVRTVPSDCRSEYPSGLAVGAKYEAVQAAVCLVAEAAEDHVTTVGATVAIDVGERDHVGRIGDIELPVAPCQAHRADKLIGKDSSPFEVPIAVTVLQNANAAISRETLQFAVQIEAGGFGHE